MFFYLNMNWKLNAVPEVIDIRNKIPEGQINVIDNLLEPNELKILEETLLHTDFQWKLNHEVIPNALCDNKYNWQFYHMLYNLPFETAIEEVRIIQPILMKLNPQYLLRAKVNLNPLSDDIHIHGYHCDIPEPARTHVKTAIFYVNTNNGYSIFEKTEKKIESVANRLIIFNCNMSHSGTTCTDARHRLVININYM